MSWFFFIFFKYGERKKGLGIKNGKKVDIKDY